MELVFAYAAGLLTLINPCVLPVLPIVLATSLQAGRQGPLVMAAGMSLSFVALGILVTAFGRVIGLTPDTISQGGAVLMIIFGSILLVPRFSQAFTTVTAGISTQADHKLDTVDSSSLTGQFVGGLLLGAVWSPCIGPTLGGAISLASQGQNLGFATAIMMSFALGVSTIILALGYGARGVLQRNQALMRKIATTARPIMGIIFLAVGIAILFRLHYIIEGWLLDVMPAWIADLSVSL